MRKIACVLGAMIVASMSLSAIAQTKTSDASKVSVFAGYSYLHYSNGTDTALYGTSEKKITANGNGFVVSAAYNFTSMFAVVGEYGFYHAGTLNNIGTLASGETVTSNMQTYLFGPKATYTAKSPINPFVQVLFGGATATVKDSYKGNTITGPRANAFAVAFGGGLDWKVTPHFSIRPAQVEYLMTRFTNSNTLTETGEGRLGDGGNNTQNSFRYSGGLVYNF